MQYVFGAYTLDMQRDELRAAAEVVRLDRQVFAVLAYLVQHHDRIVRRRELFEQLWPGCFVSDAALERCITVARRAVGDSGSCQHTIQTVHGRGYRFIAPVEERRAEVWAMETLAAPATPPPVEVLPRDPVEAVVPPGAVQLEPPCTLPSEQATPSGTWSPDPDAPEAERRHLTVLVCRLVNLPAQAALLDPEALLDVVPDFRMLCAEVVRRYAGHLAQDYGDGLVVYFGYPQAHEDDARRAVSTGLEIVEAMRRCKARRVHDREGRFAVQVGIHTGVAVMSAPDHGDSRTPLALGQTPTLAAQVQSLAPPDTVLISSATLRLVEGYVVTQALGAYRLAEASEPLVVYQVLQAQAIPSRFAVTAIKGLTPLVGREQEVGLLRERWAQAREGRGQVVMLSGEAGIGKSRLVQAFTEHLAEEGYTRLECHCSPYAQQSALYPVVEQLQCWLQWRQEMTPQDRLRTLEAALAPHGFALEEAVPLLATLFALPVPAHYPPLTLEPQRQKQKTLEALLAWWLKEAERQPVCLLVEDLHWADPSTLELLSLLIDQVPTASMLVLLLGRPEFHPPWAPRSYLLHLSLNRLVRPQVETMVAHLTGGKALPAEVHRRLIATTDGVPLFVEELTRMVLETGLVKECEEHYALTGPLPPVAIPTTLHDSLMARLDRLGAGKRIAQLGAVIGRQFAYGLLRAVAPWAEDTLQGALGQLVDAELLYQRGYPPDATYLFKHALIQAAAYQSLLKRTRHQYHQQIAQALAAHFPETVETQPELLAHHYTEAGLEEQAVAWWQRAGQRAVRHSAQTEAMRHLTKGLELLPTLPNTPRRLQHELALQTSLGTALMITKGFGHPEVKRTYARAWALCHQLGNTPELFPVLSGLWRYANGRAQHQQAWECGEHLLAIAQQSSDPGLLLQAHHALWTTAYNTGALVTAYQHVEAGLALYTPVQHHAQTELYGGHDPGVCGRSYGAKILWLLGYPDQAEQWNEAAVALAQELDHPSTLGHALQSAAGLHQWQHDAQRTYERTTAALRLGATQGAPYQVAINTVRRGWAVAMQGQVAEGITQIGQGLAAWQALDTSQIRAGFLAQLAEVYGKAGRLAEGLAALDAGLDLIKATGGWLSEAEFYRLRGELLWRAGQPEDAEACFRHALTLARRQQARSWELRAALGLSRCWQRQGKCTAAHELLAPIYDWFTEGFDTADLQEAKALLQELRP